MASAPDKAEFERLLRQVSDQAFRAARALTRNEEVALDLLQEATIQAYKGFGSFEPGTHFKAWFLRILTNRYLKTRSKGQVPTSPLEAAEDSFLYRKLVAERGTGNLAEAEGILLDRFDFESVQAALGRLPDEFRVTAVMYFLDEASYEDIAGQIGVPVGTVRSRLHRARKLLQKELWQLAEERGIVGGLERG